MQVCFSVLLAALSAFCVALVSGRTVTTTVTVVTRPLTTSTRATTWTITSRIGCTGTIRSTKTSTLTRTRTQTATVTVCPVPQCKDTTFGYCPTYYYCAGQPNVWFCAWTTTRCGENNQIGYCDNNMVCRQVNNKYGCYSTPF